jgi:hypothetical protein
MYPPGIQAAIAAQERHSDALLRTPGVVGTAVGILSSGELGMRIFLERPGVSGLPSAVDNIPVGVEVTGRFMALSDPKTKQRPAPVGFSVGHPDITAGSIGARVVDGSGNVFVLSNNHVLANSNEASLGDPTLQPGTFDGGTASDQIATLAAFQPIVFSSNASNTIDAAIALQDRPARTQRTEVRAHHRTHKRDDHRDQCNPDNLLRSDVDLLHQVGSVCRSAHRRAGYLQ